jgi:drug/metabolite transporter (DMT)-like permease
MTDSETPPILPYLALGVGIVCLSLSAIFVRWADAPGIIASFYRTGVAVMLMVVPFRRRMLARGGLSRTGVRYAILGGVFFAADLGFWSTGVMMSGAANPTLLANTAPVWVGLGALVLFHESLPPAFWIGLAVALVGAIVILGLDAIQATSLGVGSFFGLLSGIFYGGYFLVTQRGRESLDPITYFWPAAVTSTLCLLCVAILLGQPLTGYPRQTYIIFLGMGLVNQSLGYLALNYALGHLPASVVAPTMLGQPVITALLAGPLLGESLTLWQMLGGGAVLVGVYMVHHSRA